MNKFDEIHLYLQFALKDWNETIPVQVDFYNSMLLFEHPELRKSNILHTTQPHFLSFHYGKRLFVHTPSGEVHEITLGRCDGTNRYIKIGHNLEKLLISGEFKWF